MKRHNSNYKSIISLDVLSIGTDYASLHEILHNGLIRVHGMFKCNPRENKVHNITLGVFVTVPVGRERLLYLLGEYSQH